MKFGSGSSTLKVPSEFNSKFFVSSKIKWSWNQTLSGISKVRHCAPKNKYTWRKM